MREDLLTKDRPAWLDGLFIVCLVSLIGIPALLGRDLWNPDEPRYMEVACEMAESGNYLVPHLNGSIYSEKPPMFFWLTASLWKLGFGYNSGRVVSLVAALGCLLATYLLVRRYRDKNGAFISVAFIATTVFFIDYTSEGVLDALLMFFVTGAMISGFLALEEKSDKPTLLWLFAYLCMGLAILTKGPVGFIVPALTLLVYRLINRKKVQGDGRTHIIGICLLFGIVSAWLVPAIINGGKDYAHTIVIQQNFGRAVNSWSHQQPFYYYLEELPWRLFPWSLILPLAMWAAWQKWRQEGDNLSCFALVWFVTAIIFLSFMSGKRARYVLPVLPSVGILCGSYITSWLRNLHTFLRAEKWLLRTTGALMALVFLVLLAALLIIDFSPELANVFWRLNGNNAQLPPEVIHSVSGFRAIIFLLLVGLSLFLALVAVFTHSERRFVRFFSVGSAMLLVALTLGLTLFPIMNTVKSGKRFALKIKEKTVRNRKAFLYQDDFSGMYNLYSGIRKMPILRKPEDLQRALSNPKHLVITDRNRLIRAIDGPAWEQYLVYEEGVGHRCMVLLRGEDESLAKDVSQGQPRHIPVM